MAAKHNFPVIKKGATYRHKVWWQNADKTPKDLTGCTAKMQVRDDVDSPDVRLELSTENGGITLDLATAEFLFYVSDENSALLVGEGGVYDLYVYHPNGETTAFLTGTVPFQDSATR